MSRVFPVEGVHHHHLRGQQSNAGSGNEMDVKPRVDTLSLEDQKKRELLRHVASLAPSSRTRTWLAEHVQNSSGFPMSASLSLAG